MGGLPDGEVGAALEETITGVLEDGFVAVGGELSGFLAPDFIDGFAEFFGDVEAVEHVEGGGQLGGDDVEIGFPHVGADNFDFRAARGPEGFEKTGKGLSVAVADDAEKAFAPAVYLID